VLQGVIPADARAVRAYPLVAGRFLAADDSDAVVITQTLADFVGVAVGGQLTLPTVAGVIPLQVVGIFPPRTEPGSEQVLVTLATAQRLIGIPDKINLIDFKLDCYGR
jgi:putative ABC transport system permease protein